MQFKEISNTRIYRQQIDTHRFSKARDLVGWMGAMQAQDYNMSKWAVGLRVQGATQKSIEKAIDEGEIIRTHLLRPTWHFVSADDIYWILELSAPRLKTSLKTRHKALGITPAMLKKSRTLFEKALIDGNHLTRKELVTGLKNAGIDTGDNRASHLLMLAELDGLICSGRNKDGQPTYALLEDRVPRPKPMDRDEALAKLAGKYFTSRGPATIQDFIWWSGLRISDARRALDILHDDLHSVAINSDMYWFTEYPDVQPTNRSVHLLPAFDEFLIAYKDRTASIIYENEKKTISSNGIFHPVIVIGGKIEGMWKRGFKKNKVEMETTFFYPPNDRYRHLTKQAAGAFGNFLGKEVAIFHK